MNIFKNGNLMVVTDDWGVIDESRDVATGIYLEDTKYIARVQLDIGRVLRKLHTDHYWYGMDNVYLSKSVPDALHYDIEVVEKFRATGNNLEVELEIHNFSMQPVEINVGYEFVRTYEDIFSIRARNEAHLGIVEKNHNADMADKGKEYEDETTKYLIQDSLPSGTVSVKPQEMTTLNGFIHLDKTLKKPLLFKDILEDRPVQFEHDPEPFYNPVIRQGLRDLKALMVTTEFGDFPAAGLPWYATIFGRDSIIFALQILRYFPDIAKTILRVHNAFQAKSENDFTDAVPGKIVHEVRLNPMSIGEEIPFKSYYGTVDATLLYIVLASEYLEETGDLSTIGELLSGIEAAEKWIEDYADIDKDGYIEYQSTSRIGLTSQGWKDSSDSVAFNNGEIAKPPVALVEVQGYLYSAYRSLSFIYQKFGNKEKSHKYESLASELKERFNNDFWMENEKYYAIALDGNNNQVNSISSNPGHCLFCRLIDENKSEHVISRLLSSELFSGWGIRTLSNKMKRYNPFSYHNGSVWPHDNSLIMIGMLRYGYSLEAKKIARVLLDALKKTPGLRLPELFSGLDRKVTGERAVEYPTSCSPQLWSIGTLFSIYEILES
ncbi:MAG: glycogen debranching protein [Kosmotoga sp.]|nr:MAG: glycogen debranching protein [Kosmotoga sp.]